MKIKVNVVGKPYLGVSFLPFRVSEGFTITIFLFIHLFWQNESTPILTRRSIHKFKNLISPLRRRLDFLCGFRRGCIQNARKWNGQNAMYWHLFVKETRKSILILYSNVPYKFYLMSSTRGICVFYNYKSCKFFRKICNASLLLFCSSFGSS